MRLHHIFAAALASVFSYQGPNLMLDYTHMPSFGRSGRGGGSRTNLSGMTRNGGRSKYMPHIGAKERGRWAGRTFS